MTNTRLIERWLPIAALSEESVRERRSMTALPPVYYLHVWWARRPLVASRAAVLASLLPETADREKFMHVLGIHGDPVTVRRRLDVAKRKGKHLGANPYGYKRAFSFTPSISKKNGILKQISGSNDQSEIRVLDPTAGGGSIPFEANRLGITALANDLNPVAALLLKSTIEWPSQYGTDLVDEFEELSSEFIKKVLPHYQGIFPAEYDDVQVVGYLWARTINCPYCDGLVPLSPNWRLAPGGIGVRLEPELGSGSGDPNRICSFQIVESAAAMSEGTVRRGTATCPFSDCRRVIDGKEVKRQAQAGQMGEQLYTVVYKQREIYRTKAGHIRERWVRKYRAPRPEDDNSAEIRARLDEKMPEWEAFDIVPNERIPDGNKTIEPIRYGMKRWRDMFSPRQLLCHGTSVEVFREMLEADEAAGKLDELRRAAYGYLALALDKVLSYNCIMCRWHPSRGVVAQIFDRHDYSFKWSYTEMAPLVAGVGYDWAIRQVAKCIGELVKLSAQQSTVESGPLYRDSRKSKPRNSTVTVTCKSADCLDHLDDASVDAVVMDPPYYDNVMYAELSDFFYVWLKRTAGQVFPQWFRSRLTDKDSEAVANVARFKGQKGAKALAGKDYQERMAAIFEECRRVLKPDGIMTLMFMHKATGAWDALTTGLIKAGFVITASWPIKTESSGSLHIRNKAAAKSTIFLACRPRDRSPDAGEVRYWEDVEPTVAKRVRERVKEFQDAGISGVDLYLACFGPALQEFSRHWPLRRGTPRTKPKRPRGAQRKLFSANQDLYAVTPEDALNTARREVKQWRLEQLTQLKVNFDLDPPTAFVVLAWDAFQAPRFPYDEGLSLARAVGADLEADIVGRLAAKKGSDLILWDSATRAAKRSLGPPSGSRAIIDMIHHAADTGRQRSLAAAREYLDKALPDKEAFLKALTALLEVLPPGGYADIELTGDLKGAGDDFKQLWGLSRLAFRDKVRTPEQLKLWNEHLA